MNTTFTKMLFCFSGEMIKMVLITLAFVLLGTKGVSVQSLIFLLIMLIILVAQFIYFQRKR
jgi:hypothetical protein